MIFPAICGSARATSGYKRSPNICLPCEVGMTGAGGGAAYPGMAMSAHSPPLAVLLCKGPAYGLCASPLPEPRRCSNATASSEGNKREEEARATSERGGRERQARAASGSGKRWRRASATRERGKRERQARAASEWRPSVAQVVAFEWGRAPPPPARSKLPHHTMTKAPHFRKVSMHHQWSKSLLLQGKRDFLPNITRPPRTFAPPTTCLNPLPLAMPTMRSSTHCA